jgi:hypothetical protein
VYFSNSYLLRKLGIVLAIYAAVISCKPTAVMTETERKSMNELTQNMQTHCVGRYLIDVPRDFKGGTSQAVGYRRNFVIKSLGKMSKVEFEQKMTQLQTLYASKKHRKGWKYLYETLRISSDITLFHMLESDSDMTEDSRAIEGYKWSNGFVISMVAKAIDADMEKATDAAMTRDLGHDVPQKIALLTKMLTNVQGRETNEIPKEPGFCFDGGFLPGRAGQGKELEIDEELSGGLFNKKTPDIHFHFDTSTHYQQKELLLQGDNLDKLLALKNARVLRKGEVALSGVAQVQEWLVYGDTDDGNLVNGKQPRGHYFKIEGNTLVSNPLAPRVELTMRTGQAVREDENSMSTTSDSSLSDAQALALWDAVSKSIRLRTGQ